jgi:chorismate mutase
MMHKQRNLAICVAFAISGIDTARAQDPLNTLRPLVEISARRLAVAEQVALAKWDSRLPVEDPSREAQVIESAVKQGESAGLNTMFVSNFFRAQIEANKTVQYHLLADWYRAGGAPVHTSTSLSSTLRLELDHLQGALIAELVSTRNIRANEQCHNVIARAIGQYLSSHNHDHRSVQAIALDRALAATCSL